MSPSREAALAQDLRRILKEQQWQAEFEYTVRFGNRVLRADAVLFLEGRIVAVIEVKARMRGDETAATTQVRLLAQALGAPYAFLWTGQDVIDVGVMTMSLLRLPTFPTPAGLRGKLKQVFGWTGTVALCKDVSSAVQLWQREGGSRIASVTSGALAYYHGEFEKICHQHDTPLIQCVLIGGMYEGMLRDVLAHHSVPKSTGKATLGVLIDRACAAGYLTPAITDQAPKVIADNRNSLHPDAYAANPIVGSGIAANSAAALIQAVTHLNTVV